MPISIQLEPPPAIAFEHDYALLCAAADQGKLPSAWRARLARLGNRLDRFDEVIARFDGAAMDGDAPLADALIAALLARQQAGDAARALAVADAALATMPADAAPGTLLAARAKAMLQAGDSDAALADCQTILRRDPANSVALDLYAAIQLHRGAAAALLAQTDALMAQSVAHPTLIGVRCEALATLGQVDQARALAGLDRLLLSAPMAPPAGWASPAALHEQIEAELMRNPRITASRAGKASVDTIRIDAPLLPDSPALAALAGAIIDDITRRVAAMAGDDRCWLAAMPTRATLSPWALVAGGAGHERWHNHPRAWLSGSYYVAVPDAVVAGDDDAGCLLFGQSPDRIPATAAEAYGVQRLRPSPGLLVTFPSYAVHRTRPHGTAQRRICVAFDVVAA